MAMAGMHPGVWRRAIPRIPANGSATKHLPTPPTAPQALQKSQPSLRMAAWLPHSGQRLPGRMSMDAGRTGPQRQHVPGIVGDYANVLHGDPVLVEYPE